MYVKEIDLDAECLICGAAGPTRFALVRWAEGKPEFTSGPRCVDVAGCRARVEAGGERWLVVATGAAQPDTHLRGFTVLHHRAFEYLHRWQAGRQRSDAAPGQDQSEHTPPVAGGR